jgi:hypothetical protein
MEKPIIVRGSHPNDYHGFVDVVPTYRNVETFTELEKRIQEAENFMKRREVKVHCEDWGQPYSEEIHFLIQEQGSNIVGSSLRHPHTRDLHIEYVELIKNIIMNYPSPLIKFIDIKEGRTELPMCIMGDEEQTKIAKEVIELYEKLENSGILDPSFSQQIEFGLNPLMFYQARPFKKFQPVQNFEMPPLEKNEPFIWAPLVFGITPKEGIELNFKMIKITDLLGPLPHFGKSGKNYGLVVMREFRKSPPLNKKFNNLTIYCSYCPFGKLYLTHANYRSMKKTEYSMIGITIISTNNSISEINSDQIIFEEQAKLFKKSRFFSNGESSRLIPTKFL